jgi:cytochrome c oxidase subunit 1
MEGKKGLTPAEPLGDIHMPNPSFLPFVISLGLFIAALGFLYNQDYAWGKWVGIVGLLVTLGAMFLRSVIDDHGFHIHKEEIMEAEKKGAGA